MIEFNGPATFHVVNRLDDVSGISGTGAVAYLIDLGLDGQLLLWDTTLGRPKRPTHGIEIMPDRTMVDIVHGHQGATVVEPITTSDQQAALELLLSIALPRMRRIVARFGSQLGDAGRGGEWFRVGRSNSRNVYLATGGPDWKADQPVGSMYRRLMGILVADALNEYCAKRPNLVADHLYELIASEAGDLR